MTLVEDVVVESRRQDGRDRRLADLASSTAPVSLEQFVEGADLTDADQVEQLLSAVGKVFADVIVDLDAGLLELAFENVADERYAGTAARAGLRAALDVCDGVLPILSDDLAQSLLVDVVAGTNGCRIGKTIRTQGGSRAHVVHQELLGVLR